MTKQTHQLKQLEITKFWVGLEMNLKNAIEWWVCLGDKLRTDLGERVWKSISNVRIFEAVKSFITHSARFTVGVCLPSQSARIRKVQSRKKVHKPLRTLWVGHVTIEYTNLCSFRAPMLWFINLTVATCHIQYTSLSLCHFFFIRENGQNTKIRHFRMTWKLLPITTRAKH